MPHSKGWSSRRDERSSKETPIGDIVAGLLREPLFSRGMAVGRLAAGWEEIVGPKLGSQTAPESLDEGVLVVRASTGPFGAQARFLAEEIRLQANAALGSELVRQVRIVVRPEG
ncbi:MAG: DUF721 domain-containing protein [Actinomycetota bacterium]